MSWPNDADGDVFRSLESRGIDFDKEYKIDINLDFDHWPLSPNELKNIMDLFPTVELIEPDLGEDIGNGVDIGFLQFQITHRLNYIHITELQKSITEKISKYGGRCDSWGVGSQ